MTHSQPPKTVRYRAFCSRLPKRVVPLRITVEGANGQECEERIRAICRDYRLPIKRTLATMRRVPISVR